MDKDPINKIEANDAHDKDIVKKIAAKDADQYLLRLPPGLRDQVARRAAENGRSMNTEIVEAIEQHLTRADRVSQLWELFEKHRENIEAIPVLLSAVEGIEHHLSHPDDGTAPAGLYWWKMRKIQEAQKRRDAREDAYVATLPLVTPKQVKIIKAILEWRSDHSDHDTADYEEKMFFREMKVSRVEDIRGFERAMDFLDEQWAGSETLKLDDDQVRIIKALLKETGSDEESFIAPMGMRRIQDIRGFQRAMRFLGKGMSNAPT
jgi:hypothetical protein